MKNQNPAPEGSSVSPRADSKGSLEPLRALPGEEDIAELEMRLEMFLLSLSPSQPLEPCVWACGCFLTHGDES